MKPLLRWIEVVQWAIVAAMFGVGALVWNVVPDQIPIHWNLAGQVDRYAGKLEGLFLLPVVTLLVAIGLRLLPRVDPNRVRYAEFAGAFAVVRLTVTGALAGIYGVIVLVALGVQLNVGLLVNVLVGLLLVVIGAIMDRLRPNWFVGIRTPWTLSSEESWTATHRAGKWVFIAMGLAFVLAGLVQTAWAITAAVAIAIAGVLGLVVYSYRVWRRAAL